MRMYVTDMIIQITLFGNLSRLQSFSLIYAKGWETTLPKTDVKHKKLNLLFIATMAQVWPITLAGTPSEKLRVEIFRIIKLS